VLTRAILEMGRHLEAATGRNIYFSARRDAIVTDIGAIVSNFLWVLVNGKSAVRDWPCRCR